MNRKIGICLVAILAVGFLALPVYAQAEQTGGAGGGGALHWFAFAMAIAAAACGYAQSKTLTAGCEGVSRNPGAAETVRFFIILGLAFIEFLALLTFVLVLILLAAA